MDEQVQKDLQLFRCHIYRSKRLKDYRTRMSKDRTKVLVDDNVKSVLEAQGFHVDESPRSIYSVEKLYKALAQYAPGKIPKLQIDTQVSEGIALAYKCFARKSDQQVLHVLPFTPETIVRVTSNPSGSPGVTNYGCSKAESMTRALERGLQTLNGVKQPEPCLGLTRTQFNEKTRLVWGYPYSMTVIEGLVAYPLLSEFKKGHTPMAFSMPTGVLGTKMRVASYHKEWAYSLDMSQFDATLSSTLIHTAFKILRTWYQGDEVEPVSGKTVDEIFNVIEKYFIHTTIVMPDGNIYIGKDHGVPSGSYFTQMIDSVCNVIIGGTISAKFNLHVDKNDIFVLGDDLQMWSNRAVSLDVIAAYASEKLSVKMHGDEKSEICHYDQELHYLGRDWVNGLPSLSEDEVLKRMVYPESFRKYPKVQEEVEHQVHMMMLSYASVYRSAWRIACRVIDPNAGHNVQGCSHYDVNTYIYEKGQDDIRPEMLSGLQRYNLRFKDIDKHGDIPNSAIQYWL